MSASGTEETTVKKKRGVNKAVIYILVALIVVGVLTIIGLMLYKNCNKEVNHWTKLSEMLGENECNFDLTYKKRQDVTSYYRNPYDFTLSGRRKGNAVSFDISDKDMAGENDIGDAVINDCYTNMDRLSGYIYKMSDEYGENDIGDVVIYNNDCYINMDRLSGYIYKMSDEYGEYFNNLGSVGYVLFNETTISEANTIYSLNKSLDFMGGMGDTYKSMLTELASIASSKSGSEDTNAMEIVAKLSEYIDIFENMTEAKIEGVKNGVKLTCKDKNKNVYEIVLTTDGKKVEDIMVPNKTLNVADLADRLMLKYIEIKETEME